MNKYFLFIISFLLIVSGAGAFYLFRSQPKTNSVLGTINSNETPAANPEPLSIAAMRQKSYPGSPLVIESTLEPGSNYHQYVASYLSDGLKIYGLLTVPQGAKPSGGWPVILFIHGYIPPKTYKTTERYVAYVEAFAKNGYLVFKPDLRGNGQSEGQAQGAYYSPAYTTDVLNALSSLKQYPEANPGKIGLWGHSMGGNLTLRSLVVDPQDIKAAVIWGGVVGTYDDLINNWQHKVAYQPAPEDLALRNKYRQQLVAQYGTPQTNPTFWNSIDPTANLDAITAPIELHAGGSDQEVPPAFSQDLALKLQSLGKTVEYFNYPGGDHNISSPNFNQAMSRSVAFFNKYLNIK